MNSSPKSSAISSGLTLRLPGWAVAVLILAVGAAALAFLFRDSTSDSAPNSSAGVQAPPSASASQAALQARLQPLLDRLQADPQNAALLVEIGNQYYDNRDWSNAVDYYRRSLQFEPANVDVRTDMATAIWYGGNPQGAVHEYQAALKFQPNYAQTLFNLGIVEWQGEHDDRAALHSWQTLLQLHPDYPDHQKVEQLIQRVQSEMAQAGTAVQ